MTRVIALILLLLLFPLLLIISMIIIIEDGYPFYFMQKRIGRNNSFFLIFKFRSMKLDTPNLPTEQLNEPSKYIFSSAYILRKHSLDELLNLLNVLRGEMNFVGPRPALPNEFKLLELRTQNGINALKPGITGWAQINGRDSNSIEKKIELEKFYLLNKSLSFDLLILLKTIPLIFHGNNVKN